MNAAPPHPAFHESTPELRAKAGALHGAARVEEALPVRQEIVKREPQDFGGFTPEPLGGDRYSFAIRLPALALLPGKYTLRTHALDPEGLRLFDTFEVEFVVRGRTRDHGLVRLPNEWSAGRGRRRDG